jgi:hypothetical protein
MELAMTAKRHRLDLDDDDNRLLVVASVQFGLSKSEVTRRLIRASLDVGPALSRDNAETVAELSAEIRTVGRRLAQLVRTIQAGRAVGLEAARPIVEILHGRISAIDLELTRMTLGHGGSLRRAAQLGAVEAGRDEPGTQEQPG